MAEDPVGFFAFCDKDWQKKMGLAIRTMPMRRYLKLTIRGIEVIWDRGETCEVFSRLVEKRKKKR